MQENVPKPPPPAADQPPLPTFCLSILSVQEVCVLPFILQFLSNFCSNQIVLFFNSALWFISPSLALIDKNLLEHIKLLKE